MAVLRIAVWVSGFNRNAPFGPVRFKTTKTTLLGSGALSQNPPTVLTWASQNIPSDLER
jgi:hypothetical protein